MSTPRQPALSAAAPGPRTVFDLGTRITGFGLAASSAWIGALSLNPWAWLPGAWGAMSLLRVPRARLALEIAVGYVFLLELLAAAGLWSTPATAAVACAALVALSLIRTRPETGLFRMNGEDRQFVANEYPGCHINVHFVAELEKPLKREPLEGAIAAVMRDLPGARSFVREAFLGCERFYAKDPWLSGSALLSWSERPLEEAREELMDRPFDLRREPAFRVVHAVSRGRPALAVTVHHSLGDGRAGMYLLQRLLERYNELSRGLPLSTLAPEPAPVRFRQLLRPKGAAWVARSIRRHFRALSNVGVLNLAPLDDDRPSPSPLAYRIFEIGPDRSSAMRATGKPHGFTRNDFLLAAGMRAVAGWGASRRKTDRPIAVMLPADLRGALGRKPCLQNFVGLLPCEFAPARALSAGFLPELSAQVRRSREFDEAIGAPVNLGVLNAIVPLGILRGELRRFDRGPKNMLYSFVLTNFRGADELPAPEGSAVRAVWGRVAVSRQPGMGFIVVPDDRDVRVTIEYRSAWLRHESAAEIEKLFLAELDRLIADPLC